MSLNSESSVSESASDAVLDGERMHRRDAIKRVTVMLGGLAFVGGSSVFAACGNDRSAAVSASKSGKNIGNFTPADVAWLDDVADTILPDTAKSPGAKAAAVGAYIAVTVTDCYTAADQKVFRDGMTALDAACAKLHNTTFQKATPAQRLQLLESLDREAKTYMDSKAANAPSHYFRMIKELTFIGYFTSEIGMTKALRYVETPGRFDPCVPYTKGEPSWANHA